MDINQGKALMHEIHGYNLLITGFPGSGKSYLSCKIAKDLHKLGNVVKITASTGVASVNLHAKLNSNAVPLNVSTIHKTVGMRDGRFRKIIK